MFHSLNFLFDEYSQKNQRVDAMAKFLFFPGILFIVCSLRIWAQTPVKDLDTLRRTAEQWVAIILEFNGHWHGEKTATVEEIREFKEGE